MNIKDVEICICLDSIDRQTMLDAVKALLDANVQCIEIGTTLLYAFGMNAVHEVREIVTNTARLGVDLKTQDGCFNHLKRALEYGADYATVCVSRNKAALLTAPRAQKETGVGAAADLSGVHAEDFSDFIKELDGLGFSEIRINRGYDAYVRSNREPDSGEMYRKALDLATRTPISAVCFDIAGVREVLESGVKKIVLNPTFPDERYIKEVRALLNRLNAGN